MLSSCHRSIVLLAYSCALFLGAGVIDGLAWSFQEEVDSAPMTPEQEMESLSLTLKAAVMSGSMSQQDASNVWRVMMITVKEEAAANQL
ncbi:MAG: hypothetical protein MK085_08930, partial [Phycisphaerales bacterium]|nr:hypothetical protein [Phycisphaerales bacterium]